MTTDGMHDEIEILIVKTTERTSPALDARIARSTELAAGIADAVGEFESASAVRRPWRHAAAIAAGIVVVASLGYFLLGTTLGWFGAGRREDAAVAPHGDPPPRPDESELSTASIDPHAADSDAERVDTTKRAPSRVKTEPTARDESSKPVALGATTESDGNDPRRRAADDVNGIPSLLDAEATVRHAKIIARLHCDGPPAKSDGAAAREGARVGAKGRITAEITAIYQGDLALVSTTIELRPGFDQGMRSFLAWDDDASEEIWKSDTSFIACLEPIGSRTSPSGQRVFRVALGDGYAVTLVADELEAPVSNAGSLTSPQLFRDLVNSVSDPRTAVRVSASTALRHFVDPSRSSKPPWVWSNQALASRLLDAARDVDPRVRDNIAALDPAEVFITGAGQVAIDGRKTLNELFFDPVPLVRRSAEPWLMRHPLESDLVDPRGSPAALRKSLHDEPFEERHSRDVRPATIHVTTRRDVERALEVLADHAQPELRMQYAEALASAKGIDNPDVVWLAVGALTRALRDEDVEVRRAAAESLGQLGDRTIVGGLLTFAKNEDLRVLVAAAASRLQLGDPSGLSQLRQLIAGADLRAATQALFVSGRLAAALPDRWAELVAILFDALGDPRPAVRGEALATLASLAADLDRDERTRLDAAIATAAADASPYVVLAANAAPGLIELANAADYRPYLKALGYTK